MVTHHGVSLGASFASESRFGFASAPRLGGSVSSFIDFPGAPIDVSSQLNVELVRSSLVHLSVEREGLGRLDAVGGALRSASIHSVSGPTLVSVTGSSSDGVAFSTRPG